MLRGSLVLPITSDTYHSLIQHGYHILRADQVTKEAFIYCQMSKRKTCRIFTQVPCEALQHDAPASRKYKTPHECDRKRKPKGSSSSSNFTSVADCLLAVPHSGDLGVSHLLLQLEDTEHEGFGGGRAAGDVDVDGDDAVTAAGDGVGVVVVTATVGA